MTKAAALVASALLACATMPRENRAGARALSPEQVRVAQRTLRLQGYAARLSGQLDDETRAAIARFQRDADLPETSELDAATLRRLDVDPGDVHPVRAESASPDLDRGQGWKGM
jgi:hypothetical protein